MWLVLLLPLFGGISVDHLVEREAKVNPPQEVVLHFLEARCVQNQIVLLVNAKQCVQLYCNSSTTAFLQGSTKAGIDAPASTLPRWVLLLCYRQQRLDIHCDLDVLTIVTY